MSESQAEKNKRKLELFTEMGVLLGPIIERETNRDRERLTDCLDCLMTHVAELLHIYYNLDHEQAMTCYKLMRAEVLKATENMQKRKREILSDSHDIILPGDNDGNESIPFSLD